MNALKVLVSALLIVSAVCVRAAAWTDAVHENTALSASAHFPTPLRNIVKSNQKAYLDGVKNSPELYDELVRQKEGFSTELLRFRGMERFVYHIKRMQRLIDAKAEGPVQAAELGALSRVALDMLEPAPPSSSFRPLETAGHRMFFHSDFEPTAKKFNFLFDGSTVIKDIPARVDADMDFANEKGSIIYEAYRRGASFKTVDSEAQAALNRALNLLTDVVYTLHQTRGELHKNPYSPENFLRLERFKKQSKIKGGEIEGPKGPSAPDSPNKPDVQKPDQD